MLIDSHCHLDRLDLKTFEGDLDKAIAAAADLGVERIINVSVTWEDFPTVLAIAERYPNVYASVGVHPTEVGGIEPTVEMLVEKVQHPKVVAIGETGLDYFRLSDDPAEAEKEKQLQQARFRCHIEAGKLANKPLIIHTRHAREDTIAILRECQAGPGVFHCFTESWEMAEQGMALGMMISFSGIVTFKNATELKAVAKQVPLEQMLVETDAPYLTPVPYRGKANQPGYTRYVAEHIAELRGVTYEEVAKATTENVERLFGLDVVK